ncbi:hypothetical protein AAC387_Pa09g1115 [Persea americana]
MVPQQPLSSFFSFPLLFVRELPGNQTNVAASQVNQTPPNSGHVLLLANHECSKQLQLQLLSVPYHHIVNQQANPSLFVRELQQARYTTATIRKTGHNMSHDSIPVLVPRKQAA